MTPVLSRLRSFVYDIYHSVPPERKLSRDAILMIILHGCFRFGTAISQIFIQLYLWRLTEDLWLNGMYIVIQFTIAPFIFAYAGKISKTVNPLIPYRLGIVFTVVFFLLVLIVQERMVDYYYVFAALNSLVAFYWLSFLSLTYDVTTEKNRLRFLSLNMIFFQLAGLVGPALAGWIIARSSDLSGYTTVFMIALIMFIITMIGSFFLRINRTRRSKYHLKLIGLVMRRNPAWVRSLWAWFVLGTNQGLMTFLPNILLLAAFGQEDLVGYMNVLFLSIAMFTSYLLARIGVHDKTRRYIAISVCGIVLSATLLLWDISIWTVLLMMIIYNFSHPIQIVAFDAYQYNLINTLPLKGSLKEETVVVRELFVHWGRIIAILFLIFFVSDLGGTWLPWIVFGSALLQLSMIWLVSEEKA